MYIVECSNKTLYTEITNDISARIRAHIRLVYKESCGTKSAAMKRKLVIEKYKRQEKLILSKAV